MLLKRFISIFFCLSGFYLANGQTHMLIGSASDIVTVGGNYYSWSIGEVIVFNESPNPEISIAQSMQSYINPPKVDCMIANISSSTTSLCEGTTAFQQILTFNYTPVTAPVSEVQWYFSEKPNAPDTGYFKVIGASTSILNKTYQPYFPGYYRICLKSKVLGCSTCSKPFEVKKIDGNAILPYISPNGQPANILTVNFDPNPTLGSSTVQWYAFIPTLKRYLLVVGGTQPSLKVRYDGDYMAIVSYEKGCKMSATFDVNGYNKPLYRATDTKIDGNTIYIPEETAYERSALKVFPNPATNTFTVQYESSSEIVSKAELYSNTGLAVKEIKFNEGAYWSKTAIVNTEDLSAGVYFLKINEGDRQIVEKVVLQK